jgi:hypothetical protein
MITGLAATLPNALLKGLTSHGVPAIAAQHAAATPPVGNLFAAFLGYNPIAALLGAVKVPLSSLSPSNVTALTGHAFFPQLISGPFHAGLIIVFVTAAILSVIGAIASVAAGGKYLHTETVPVGTVKAGQPVRGEEPVDAALSDV